MSVLTHEPLPSRPHLEKASESEHILVPTGLRLLESAELAVPQAQRGRVGTEGAGPTLYCAISTHSQRQSGASSLGGHDQSEGR